MGWELESVILSRVNLTLQKQQQILSAVQNIDVSQVPQSLVTLITTLTNAVSDLITAQQVCCQQLNSKLDKQASEVDELESTLATASTTLAKILQALIPPPAVSFISTITAGTANTANIQGEHHMAKATRTVAGDLQVADNGTFTVNNSFLDSDQVPTAAPAGLALTYTSSDSTPGPSVLTLTPSADTSSCAGSINQAAVQALVAAGTALPTGLTITVAGTWTGLATPASVVAAPPIDVVAGTAGSFVAAATTP
jgi:hypothetical protein